MLEQCPECQRITAAFDAAAEPIGEQDVDRALKDHLKSPGAEPTLACEAEAAAFGFTEDYAEKPTGWGTYYGPGWVLADGKGGATEWPSLSQITPDVLEYWTRRADAALHPVMRARYADLVCDFSEKVTGTPAPVRLRRLVAEATAEAVERALVRQPTRVRAKLERAIGLALGLNDKDLVARLAQATIAYDKAVASDEKPGLCGMPFTLLVMNPKVGLEATVTQGIIDAMEERLSRLAPATESGAKARPFAAKTVAIQLATWYRKKGRQADVRRVLLQYGAAMRALADAASGIAALAWYQELHEIYSNFALHADATEVSIALREAGRRVPQELKRVASTVEIPEAAVEAFLARMLEGDEETVLRRVAMQFIVRRSDAEAELASLRANSTFSFLIRRQIVDRDGRPVVEVGTFDEDAEGHTVLQVAQQIGLETPLLGMVLDRWREGHKPNGERVVDRLMASPLFSPMRRELLVTGCEAYLAGDHIAALHILLPQVEEAIRRILELGGGATLRSSRSGRWMNRVLDDLLRDSLVIATLGEDVALYSRVVLTDARGFNMRNVVCHGLAHPAFFGRQMSDRLLHILLCLGLVRLSNEPAPDTPEVR